MKRSMLLSLAGVAVVIAACGGERAEQEGVISTETATPPMAEPAPPAAAPPATTPPAGAAMAETASVRELGGSGLSGEVSVRPQGQQTEVMVRLTGTQGGANHPGHIHSGTCDSVGGVVQPLQPITADATGAGTMTATVDLPPTTVMNGQHVVVYHGQGGTPIACAEIPQHRM